jgi:hypothetical protein
MHRTCLHESTTGATRPGNDAVGAVDEEREEKRCGERIIGTCGCAGSAPDSVLPGALPGERSPRAADDLIERLY